jgi:hypothetical protein
VIYNCGVFLLVAGLHRPIHRRAKNESRIPKFSRKILGVEVQKLPPQSCRSRGIPNRSILVTQIGVADWGYGMHPNTRIEVDSKTRKLGSASRGRQKPGNQQYHKKAPATLKGDRGFLAVSLVQKWVIPKQAYFLALLRLIP